MHINVGVFDDHKIVRNGMRAIFHNSTDIKIVYEAANVLGIFNEPSLFDKIDVFILDIDMPEMSGIEFISKAKQIKPNVKVLIFSAYCDEYHIASSIRAGALGYVSKDAENSILINAVKEIYQGNEYFGGIASRIVFRRFSEQEKVKGTKLLNNRELKIIKCIAQGLSVKDISDKLCVSVRTIETDKNAIMTKLGISSNIDLVKFAIKEQIINI